MLFFFIGGFAVVILFALMEHVPGMIYVCLCVCVLFIIILNLTNLFFGRLVASLFSCNYSSSVVPVVCSDIVTRVTEVVAGL